MSHSEFHSEEHVAGGVSARRELRPPLPAGDPVSWGAITRGTVLEGMPWPGAPMTRAAPSTTETTARELRLVELR